MTSITRTSTFTVTNARYLASKVASDLRQIQRLYGTPTDERINDYLLEIVILLGGSWLDEVCYGFWRNGNWIPPVLSYAVNSAGNLVDNRPGGVLAGTDITGASWYSYLKTTTAWAELSENQRSAINSTIPIKRSSAPEPGVSGGYWEEGDRHYASGGVGIQRRSLRPL